MNQISPLDRSDSDWDAIADLTEEAANLYLWSELPDKIAALIESKGLSQADALNRCRLTHSQSRMIDLFRDGASLDALVNGAATLGQRVHAEGAWLKQAIQRGLGQSAKTVTGVVRIERRVNYQAGYE